MAIDLRVAKLLCSRLCHDLISPASAVNAGLELMEEQPDSDDAMDLIIRSAKQVTRRLAFYRSAFGAGGVTTLPEARKLAAGLLADGNVVLDWPGDEGGPVSPSARRCFSIWSWWPWTPCPGAVPSVSAWPSWTKGSGPR